MSAAACDFDWSRLDSDLDALIDAQAKEQAAQQATKARIAKRNQNAIQKRTNKSTIQCNSKTTTNNSVAQQQSIKSQIDNRRTLAQTQQSCAPLHDPQTRSKASHKQLVQSKCKVPLGDATNTSRTTTTQQQCKQELNHQAPNKRTNPLQQQSKFNLKTASSLVKIEKHTDSNQRTRVDSNEHLKDENESRTALPQHDSPRNKDNRNAPQDRDSQPSVLRFPGYCESLEFDAPRWCDLAAEREAESDPQYIDGIDHIFFHIKHHEHFQDAQWLRQQQQREDLTEEELQHQEQQHRRNSLDASATHSASAATSAAAASSRHTPLTRRHAKFVLDKLALNDSHDGSARKHRNVSAQEMQECDAVVRQLQSADKKSTTTTATTTTTSLQSMYHNSASAQSASKSLRRSTATTASSSNSSDKRQSSLSAASLTPNELPVRLQTRSTAESHARSTASRGSKRSRQSSDSPRARSSEARRQSSNEASTPARSVQRFKRHKTSDQSTNLDSHATSAESTSDRPIDKRLPDDAAADAKHSLRSTRSRAAPGLAPAEERIQPPIKKEEQPSNAIAPAPAPLLHAATVTFTAAPTTSQRNTRKQAKPQLVQDRPRNPSVKTRSAQGPNTTSLRCKSRLNRLQPRPAAGESVLAPESQRGIERDSNCGLPSGTIPVHTSVPVAVPMISSIAAIKRWEFQHSKRWFDLSFEERETAHREIQDEQQSKAQ